MNILIFKDDHQDGPYSWEEVEAHLQTGVFTRDDLARTEGQVEWKPLSDVLDSFTTMDRLSTVATGEPTADRECKPNVIPAPQTGRDSVFDKVKTTAHLAQKQALRKKLKLVELRKANFQLGKKAFEQGMATPECSGITSKIELVRMEIAALEREGNPQSAPSFADRAKEAANATGRATKSKGLMFRHDQLLAELGSKISEDANAPLSVSDEMATVQAVQAKIGGLDAEILQMSGKTYKWARQPLILGGIICGCLLLYVTYEWVGNRSAHGSWQQEISRAKEKQAE